MKLLKTLLEGGGKYSMDEKGVSLKAPVGAFADTDLSIPGFEESYSRVSGIRTDYTAPERTRRPVGYNPSASPLDSADLVGLTPENISQALQLKFAGEELGRKRLADLSRTGYYGAAIEKMRAETAAIPAKQFISAWKVATEDERTAAMKNYDFAVSQGYEGKFEEWLTSLAEASGKSTERILADFVAKKGAGTALELAGPDFVQDVRTDLMKDRSKWGFPPAYEGLVGKGLDETKALDLSQKMMVIEEMDTRVRSFYKGKEVERRSDGWYVGGRLVVRNPYGGR